MFVIKNPVSSLTLTSLDKFIEAQIIDGGTYGDVYEYYIKKIIPDNEPIKKVAIKKINYNNEGICPETLRELDILANYKNSPHIVKLLGVHSKILNGDTYINIVTELCTCDLHNFINKIPLPGRIGNNCEILLSITHQLLMGLSIINNNNIIHRDIKPKNILVNYEYDYKSNKFIKFPICKIADMGLGRKLVKISNRPRSYTNDIYTNNYKAPEVIVSVINNETLYNYKSEIWALGCVIYQYIHNDLLFKLSIYDFSDKSYSTLINQIKKLLPQFNTIPFDEFRNKFINLSLHTNLPLSNIIKNKILNKSLLVEPQKYINNDFLKLLDNMMELHPNDRIDINDLLDNKCFKNLNVKSINLVIPDNIDKNNILYPKIDYVCMKKYIIILFDWLLEVCRGYKITIPFIYCADIFNRLIYNSENILDKDNLQLYGLTCLWLSLKFDGIYISSNDCLHYCDNAYNSLELKKCELIVLDIINYSMHSTKIDMIVKYVKRNMLNYSNIKFNIFKKNNIPQIMIL